MEHVSFITVQDGEDLIVSFAISGDGVLDVKSLTLLRTPKFEFLLAEAERGVTVSCDDFPEEEGDLLQEVRIDGDEVTIVTSQRGYILNVRGVDSAELHEAKNLLRRMNFDNRFTLDVV